MPLDGLSLMGFLPEAEAQSYLREACVMQNQAPAMLRYHYQQAKKKLGVGVIARPGKPKRDEIPAGYEMYLEAVKENPRFALTVGQMAWSFKMIEADQLLAFQLHILDDRVKAVSDSVDHPPTLDQMLAHCLPHQLEAINFGWGANNNTITIHSENLNLKAHDIALSRDPATQLITAGLAFGASSPLVQVVLHDGRYFLRNGFHRVCGLRMAGAKYVPCILLEAQEYEQAVPLVGGFPPSILLSQSPPTCGHFARGYAYSVPVRKAQKVIQVSFAVVEQNVAAE